MESSVENVPLDLLCTSIARFEEYTS